MKPASFAFLLEALVAISPTAYAAEPTTVEFAGPDWLKFGNIYDGARFVIGGYPIEAEFGLNTTALAQGVVGAVQIPAEVTAPNHSAGIAGYARTSSVPHMAVGVHGFGGVTADGAQAEGGHFLGTNCGAQACPPNGGFDASNIYIIEADLNVMKLKDGSAPATNAFGLILFGASEVVPKGAFQAIRVDSPGVFNAPVLAWKEALFTADGAAKVGVNLGTSDVASIPGDSQPVMLRSRSDTGVNHAGSIVAGRRGDLIAKPSNGIFKIEGTALQIGLAQSPLSSKWPCQTGQMQWDGGYIFICVAENSWRRARLDAF